MCATYDCNVVIDLEFTQVPRKRGVEGLATEIIEMGAVKVGPDGTVLGTFSRIVKPTMATGVSGAVHWMTGIGDEDLTCARSLDEVLEMLKSWIGSGRTRFVTWSDTDRRQIERECSVKGIEHSLPSRWMDIQRLYTRLMRTSKRLVALGEAADWCGVSNDKSSAHRALYDAQVTAEIFRMMASGELESHHARLKAEMDKPCGGVLSSSIADRCSGLSDLLASLMSQEAVAA